MQAVLDGLAGILSIETDLARDAFILAIDPEQVSRPEIEAAIQGLGFRPRFDLEGDSLEASPARDTEMPLPKLVAAALEEMAAEQLLLVNFTADWCAPCRVMERVVLPDAAVQEALRDYVLLPVDTDRESEVVRRFGVTVMPTLIVLNQQGTELKRLVGLVEAEELALELTGLTERP